MPKKTRTNYVPELLEKVSFLLPGGRESLARELGVSESSVIRWINGKSRPRPELEGRLRLVAERFRPDSDSSEQTPLFGWPENASEDRLRKAVAQTCRQLRESFHRRGRLSSRQEALDELAKLLFSHVMSATHGGPGISRQALVPSSHPAKQLRQFVAQQFKSHAPLSLAHEMKAADFELQLRDSEDELALDIAGCFQHLQDKDVLASLRGLESVDVLNDAFGQFIADSFVQEKELGQYLTPNEVVRFMVRLGLSGMPEALRQQILHPGTVEKAGLILDPSCGVGTFLTEALRVIHSECKRQHGPRVAQELLSVALEKTIVGIDKSERMLRLALTNLTLFGADQVNLHLANSLSRKGRDGELTDSLQGRATLILTNPPFGASFDSDQLQKYRLFNSWSAKHQRALDSELLFIERYLDWLAPGGSLVAIVPDSILTNKGVFEDLRKGLFPLAQIKSVVSLPVVTFGVAGTSTKTSVLHLTKLNKPDRGSRRVFFAVCDSLGYDVVTRGATRVKVPRGTNRLIEILEARETGKDFGFARLGEICLSDARWDAGYHSGLSVAVQQRIQGTNGNAVRVQSVADLTTERVNPARYGSASTFQYIEISDVDGPTYAVRAKTVSCSEAPSRARKVVHVGDVLVSTVRPERRTVGVVPPELDGAICSTGFAVLRCRGIHPLVLAGLLRLDFVTEQLLKENSGIAYPAVEEARIPEVVLPIDSSELEVLGKLGEEFERARDAVRLAERAFVEGVTASSTEWVQTPGAD